MWYYTWQCSLFLELWFHLWNLCRLVELKYVVLYLTMQNKVDYFFYLPKDAKVWLLLCWECIQNLHLCTPVGTSFIDCFFCCCCAGVGVMESIPDAGSKVWLQFCVFAIEITFKTLCMLQIQPAFILFFCYLLCFSLANINWCWIADTLLQHLLTGHLNLG